MGIALKVFAMRFGKNHGNGDELLAEHPFDSSIKCMSVVYGNKIEGTRTAYTKADSLAEQGLRVLCIASKSMGDSPAEDVNDRAKVEKNLKFLGLAGLYDPPRQETAGAIEACHGAGITVHMVTGDHIKTATSIAYEIGLIKTGMALPPNAVMAAADFGALSDDQIDQIEHLPVVLARCSPLTKVRMIQALHRRKAFCIMTGDGVN